MADNESIVQPTEFDVQFEATSPEWVITDIVYDLSLKAEYLDVYVGANVTEYDPKGDASVIISAGGLVHEKASKYICRALSQQTVTPPAHLPTQTNSSFQVYTLLDYIQGYVQEHSDALIYKGTLTGGASEANTAYTPAAEKGYLYKVSSGSYINKVRVDPGDVLICNSDGTSAANASNVDSIKTKWDIVQTNVDTVDGKFSNSITVGSREDGTAIGNKSSAEGYSVTASGDFSHAEGSLTKAVSANSHAEGYYTEANGIRSHAEGNYTKAQREDSHSEGKNTIAYGKLSHAEGEATVTGNENNANAGYAAHAEGHSTLASGNYSHAEGNATNAMGIASHAEGGATIANGQNSHAEGADTIAAGINSHAEGSNTLAYGDKSHTQGENTVTYTPAGTALGKYNIPDNSSSFPDWQPNTEYKRNNCVRNSSKFYICKNNHTSATIFNSDSSKWYEIPYSISYAEIVGNGTVNTRANIRTLDWDGNEIIAGKLTLGTGPSNNMDAATKQYVDNSDALKANINSPTFTGEPKSVTPTSNSNSKMIATKEYVDLKADINNPHFTGSISLDRNPSTNVGIDSVAVGSYCEASGYSSLAQGSESVATGDQAVALGLHSNAAGENSLVFGRNNVADSSSGTALWQPSTVYEVGSKVRRSNNDTILVCIRRHQSSSNESSWNQVDYQYWEAQGYNYVEIVGNGLSTSNKSNARALDWDGNEYLKGNIFVGCDNNSANGSKLATEDYVIQWMTYKPITINSLTVNPDSKEKGSSVTSATFSYNVSRVPSSATFDGTAQSITSTTGSFTKTFSTAVTDTKTWTMQVTENKPDGSSYTASKNVKISFLYRVFYGVAGDQTTINSAFVRGLANNPLSSNGKVDFTVTSEADEYIWYASTVECAFNSNGFDGGFEPATQVNVKDAGNNNVTYYVYRSTNKGLGITKVLVK